MKQLTLNPIRKVEGEIQLPGSKSMTNRILLLSALASGTTTVSNLLKSDDTDHMLNALSSVGVSIDRDDKYTHCTVHGLARPFSVSEVELFLGNSGTSMRSLCASMCLGTGTYILTGEPRMWERPIKDLIDALGQIGAQIEYLREDGYPPLKISANGLNGGEVSIRGNISSQYLTGLLMACPMSKNDTHITIQGELVSKPYISMTIDVMQRFGVEVINNDFKSFVIKGNQIYKSPGQALVEGDASSASYFLSAGAISGKIRVNGVGSDSIQGDIAHAKVLKTMGASVSMGRDWIEVQHNKLKGIDMDLNHMPDAAMTIAVTALFAQGKTTIRNIYNWRVKETDRLTAMSNELRKVGARVTEGEDFIEILPPEKINNATIDTYDDHRIAMCFSLAAMGGTPITINDPDCVSKTFPDYFDKLAAITKR